ncbi:hypothetical protein ACFORG_02975 [Lutimaribacter marinistellae]|uniref:Uncharacterized protein n=1 Tax=Lutimaribacter marinistellae TaxID=1820329 RepID=A0ABV7TAW4_9RHOB
MTDIEAADLYSGLTEPLLPFSTLVDEAMAIGMAFLTADLLEEPGLTELQTRILTYAQTRLVAQGNTAIREAWNEFLARTLAAQAEI